MNPCIRRLVEGDSIEDLAALVRSAFAPLAREGLCVRAAHQTAEETLLRTARGDCWLALDGARTVGTVTLEPPDPLSPLACYRKPWVASVHQFAVEPGEQGHGIGRALLRTAEHWARSHGLLELALDTPQRAHHLLDFYTQQGFEAVARAQLPGRPYRSVVLAKAVAPAQPPARAARATHAPHLR